jgi:hypothetical protein
MGLESLAYLAQIVTAFFVAVSLVYLGPQVRQNARAQQAENYGRALGRVAAMQARLSEYVALSSMFSRAIVDPPRTPIETVTPHAGMWSAPMYVGRSRAGIRTSLTTSPMDRSRNLSAGRSPPPVDQSVFLSPVRLPRLLETGSRLIGAALPFSPPLAGAAGRQLCSKAHHPIEALPSLPERDEDVGVAFEPRAIRPEVQPLAVTR